MTFCRGVGGDDRPTVLDFFFYHLLFCRCASVTACVEPVPWSITFAVKKKNMAASVDQAMQMLDFSTGKLDIQLLDNVVGRFYNGNGPEVSVSVTEFFLCVLLKSTTCTYVHVTW